MMKLILTDVDGVLTDGRVMLDELGCESKSISYRDLDAIGIGRRAGYEFAFVTGEDTEMARQLAKRFGVELLYTGAKDKLAAVNAISLEFDIPLSKLVYIGDSDRYAPAIAAVGLGVSPCDASEKARSAANVLTECAGGFGVLLETMDKLISREWNF